MKLKIVILFFFVFLYTLVLTQEIEITIPNGGESWEIGSVRYVQWTATDTSNGFKITLLKDGVSVGAIGVVGPSDRSFRWEEVGRHQNGLVSSGIGYTIKVKEQRNDISDESDASFSLTDPPPCDLVITNIFTDERGKVKVTVKNQGAPIIKKVLLKAEHANFSTGGSRLTEPPLDLGTNRSKNVIICPVGDLFREIPCGTSLLVTVDPYDEVFETNNDNNSLRKEIFRYPSHDGKIMGIGLGSRNREVINVREVFIEPADCDSPYGDDVTITLQLKYSNCGGSNLTNGRFKVFQYYRFEGPPAPSGHTRVEERRVALIDILVGDLSSGQTLTSTCQETLKRKFSDWICRRNSLIFEFLCGESGPMAANNTKKVALKFRGF
jgi:hypothetical protein